MSIGCFALHLTRSQEKRQQEYYDQFSFEPQILQESRDLAAEQRQRQPRPVRAHHYQNGSRFNERGEARVKELKEAAEREFREQCTFRPQMYGSNLALKHTYIDRLLKVKTKYSNSNPPYSACEWSRPAFHASSPATTSV